MDQIFINRTKIKNDHVLIEKIFVLLEKILKPIKNDHFPDQFLGVIFMVEIWLARFSF